MNKKYIIYDGTLRMGHVELHSELLSTLRGDESKVQGGGWWHLDREKGIMYLYASSHDFGQAELKDVRKAVEEGYLTGFNKLFKFAYSTEEWLDKAVENCVFFERKKK